MLCNNCGRQTQNEEANFCDYCGHPFREHIQETIKSELPKSEAVVIKPSDKPITLLNWIGSYGLMLIPVVGMVMLLIWAFGRNTSASKKNWARATLIFIVLMMLYLITAMNLLGNDPLLRDYMNGEIGLNQFMNQIYNSQ